MNQPTKSVILRPVVDGDLPHFFAQQQVREALEMARFGPSVPDDPKLFAEKWEYLRSTPSIYIRTVEADGEVAGNVISFVDEGVREVGYWLGRDFWGRGIATQALALMLEDIKDRPLHAVTVASNLPSIRVLEKCGFVYSHHSSSHSPYLGEEVSTVVYVLP